MVFSQPAAAKAADEKAQGLHGVVHPQRRAARMRGGHPRGQAGLGGFQNVEAHKKGKQQKAQKPNAGRLPQGPAQPELHQADQGYAAQKRRLQMPARLQCKQSTHENKREQHRWQVNLPMRRFAQARLHQHRGNSDPHRQLHRMQDESAQIQAQQIRMHEHIFQAIEPTAGRIRQRRLRRHHPSHHGHANDHQNASEHKEAAEPNLLCQDRCQNQRQGKHQPNARAHQRHGFGAHGVACHVGQQSRHRRRNRSRALQRAAHDQPAQR